MPSEFIDGPVGKIEARHHAGDRPGSPMALVLHPNPQFGGSMNTLLVYTLFTVFQDTGFHVLRFNYRGVGRSEGGFTNDDRILADAECALEWMRQQHPHSNRIWIAGFSFGSWIGLKLACQSPGVEGCIAVAPPVNRLDFSCIHLPDIPLLFIHGAADALVPGVEVRRFVETRKADGTHLWDFLPVEGATHFFENHQEDVARIARQWLSKRLGKP